MGEFDGFKAIVTGSGGRMGGTIAVMLAAEGADVVLNDRLPGKVDEYEEKIKALGRDVISVVENVTRREGAKAVVDAGLERWGRIDLLVNVVGGIKGPMVSPIWETREEEWEITVGINLRANYHCTQLVAPGMMEGKFGKIVNIASTDWAGQPDHAPLRRGEGGRRRLHPFGGAAARAVQHQRQRHRSRRHAHRRSADQVDDAGQVEGHEPPGTAQSAGGHRQCRAVPLLGARSQHNGAAPHRRRRLEPLALRIQVAPFRRFVQPYFLKES